MKIDRLLGIVIYLLNRDIVNANMLSEKFEVSTRTIQRDIETLNMAGIPITSIQGVNGGYGIIDSFRLDKQITNTEDYFFIITALRGMCSAYDNKKLDETLEKLLNASKISKEYKPKIKLDFSVSKEGNINEYIKIIEKAINEERVIEFEYTNSYENKKLRLVEPVSIMYKWYSWYLFAYCHNRKDYRLFKVIRMRKLRELAQPFSMKHENVDKLIELQEKSDNRRYVHAKVLCHNSIRILIEEYFPNGKITELKNENFMLQFTVPENEIVWIGILLNLGNKIKIIEPEELKQKFVLKAQEIIDNYK